MKSSIRIHEYLKTDFRPDLTAGLTVAIMGVPQAMAYAMIAHVPPIYGLYTAVVCCLMGAIFGCSNHLITGPTNALSMVIASLIIPKMDAATHSPVELVLVLTLMVGLIQIGFGLLKLGSVMRYVSNSVVVGFTAGAGILIAANQIRNIMGVKIDPAAEKWIFTSLYATFAQITHSNPRALLIGIGTALIVVLCRKINRRIPGSLLAVSMSALLVYAFGWYQPGPYKVKILQDIEPIKGTLNIFHFPDLLRFSELKTMMDMAGGAAALAILGLVEAASIARSIAASSGQRLNFNREFTAQGIANLTGSFFSSFASSGSFTRSAVNYQSGARTRMSAIFSTLITALTIFALAKMANYIPIASLAGILVIIAYTMVEKHRLKLTWRSGRNSQMVMCGTLLATLLFPLEYAVFIGVFLSIVFLLKITGHVDLTQLIPRPDSGFDEVPFNHNTDSPIVMVNLEGDLYFAAVEDLDYELQRVLTPQTRVLILRMKRLRAVGSSAMAILEHFHHILTTRGVALVVCGVEPELINTLTRSGLREKIGEQNIFFADNRIFQSTELALARARSIVEMDKVRRDEKAIEADAATLSGLTAQDVMSRQSVRFGHQHQVREALWLLSEINRRKQSIEPQSLFLQDRDGRLAGELNMWRLLDQIAKGVDPIQGLRMSDKDLGKQFKEQLTQSIHTLARVDIPGAQSQTPFSELLQQSVIHMIRFMPVCDQDGRMIGLVSQKDLLLGLGKILGSQVHVPVEASSAQQTVSTNL